MSDMLDASIQNAICTNVRDLCDEWRRPSVVFRPSIALDGDKWSALLGANLQEGVAGFGDTPAEAMLAFDRAWHSRRNHEP